MSFKKLLIVGILPPPYSGCETTTECLLSCGLDRYFDLDFASVRTVRDPSSRGKFSLSNIFSMFKVWLYLIRKLYIFRPDVVHLTLASNNSGFLKWLLVAMSCRLFGAKIVSRLGGNAMGKFHEASNVFMRIIIRQGLKNSEVVIIQGASLKAQFDGLVDSRRLVVVPNGFDLNKWQTGMMPKKYSAKTRVLYIGQVSKAKGVLDLLHSIIFLNEKGAANLFEFIISGPIIEKESYIMHIDNVASTSKEITRIIEEKNIQSNIKFTGEVSWDEKRDLYSWADVVVLPSYSEGFPNVILEAFASDCAVICTAIGAVPDYLHDRQEVLFVPTASPRKIVEALFKVSDNKLREQLLSSGMEYFKRNHDLGVYLSTMRELYNRVLAH